jgi:hypothetical protein
MPLGECDVLVTYSSVASDYVFLGGRSCCSFGLRRVQNRSCVRSGEDDAGHRHSNEAELYAALRA